MRPLRLAGHDFMAYAEFDIDLDGIPFLAVTGANGSGKTTLFYALVWALYGKSPGSTSDVIVRDGADEAAVTFSFASGEDIVVVERTKTRGRDSSLALLVNDEARTRHTLRETQAAIVDLVGLPYDAMIAGPLVLEGRSDTFMATLPSARKTLLMTLFGLLRFQRLHEQSKDARDEARATANLGHRRLDEIDRTVADKIAVETTLGPLIAQRAVLTDARDLARDRERAAAEKVAGLRVATSGVLRLQAEKERHEAALVRAHDRQRRAEEKVADLRAIAETEVPGYSDAAYEAALDRVAEAEAAWGAAGSAYRAAGNARQTLQTDADPVTCPECGATFVPGVPEGALERAQQDEAAAKAAFDAAIAARQNARSALAGLEAARSAATRRNDALAALPGFEGALREAQVEATAAFDAAIAVKRELAGLAEQARGMNEATDELASAKTVLADAERRLDALGPEIARLEARLGLIEAWEAERPALAADVATAEELARVYDGLAKACHRDGIPTMMLEGLLPVIEERANEALAKMPGDLSMRLVTERATQKGTTEDTLDVICAKRGREREYALLSKGERFRVDLAFRLGLTAARSSRTIESLIIDEGFGSQDENGKEGMLESLASLSDEFAFVGVISHVPEVVDFIPARLEVTTEDDVAVARMTA